MLDRIKISGFKSIKNLGYSSNDEFRLMDVNLLIGGNGAGKSNFIEFFKMLRAMMGMRLVEFRDIKPSLARFLNNKGGIHNFLHGGVSITKEISGELIFNIIPTLFESYSNSSIVDKSHSWS